ncbi:hypothetical protein Agabi119p4_10626 [Agaricus bisporus var. burnettii]|uniref:Uncharacterized protein n=1 Tax=Agaricus bisporus var. burnettii TaxID=192524 RepID=A0A8H7EWS9_AGABI|nr:hypothetical protein Agabi119p4_10626 [Agaricus bisporus var. burnettii]
MKPKETATRKDPTRHPPSLPSQNLTREGSQWTDPAVQSQKYRSSSTEVWYAFDAHMNSVPSLPTLDCFYS